MCSIFGVETRSIPYAQIQESFDQTVSRGPDSSKLIEVPCGWLGFHRLAIMGLNEKGMQPFELDGSCVVCNGELYGFRPIRERLKAHYEFKSESDCEILLPLYREYGLEMFRTLDAEFALILYDAQRGSFVAARDPIGIRPLYYGRTDDGSMAFARTSWRCATRCCPSRRDATGRTANSLATPTRRTWISSSWRTRRPSAAACTIC